MSWTPLYTLYTSYSNDGQYTVSLSQWYTKHELISSISCILYPLDYDVCQISPTPLHRMNLLLFRRGKLNSQFIVTDFSILHAGGRSLFRFQTSKRVREMLGSNSRSPRPRPSIAALEGAGPKCHIVAAYNLKYENFEKSENPCGR